MPCFSPSAQCGPGCETPWRGYHRDLRLCLGMMMLVVFVTASAPATAQGADPSFREPPAGGPLLKPTCRVQGIVSRGVINLVSPVAEANRRREKLRGVATRLITLAPISTDLALQVAAKGDSAGAVTARLDDKLAAIEAAFVAGGLRPIAQNAGSVDVSPGVARTGAGPLTGQMEVVFTFAGEVEPLAAMAMVPPGLVEALRRVSYELPEPSVVIDLIRPELEREARANAAARAAALGEGVVIAQRLALHFSDDDPRFGREAAGRRRLAVSAVATYTLSRPPGSSALSE